MNRDEFNSLCDDFSDILTLPKIGGKAKMFLFKKFEELTQPQGKKVFAVMASTWTNGWYPRPGDFEPHIVDALREVDANAAARSKFYTSEEERPSADDWAAFEATVSGLSRKMSIPDALPDDGTPEERIARWEINRNECVAEVDRLNRESPLKRKK